jgi:methylphosphonate synthase
MESVSDTKNPELVRFGNYFLGMLNDLKRRPEDAANELNVSLEEIMGIIEGKKEITSKIISRAVKIWPVNYRDFFLIHDDCPDGIKIMRNEDSAKSSRVMDRGGMPYYEYRDTAMSSVALFRPEWIEELCIVEDNDPNNLAVQWNNGHFMHQFTYFIGDVNYYYRGPDGEKKVAIMNTGDSVYGTPFRPHSFATRKGAKKNGLILALTYGNQLAADTQQELSAIGKELSLPYWLDFSSRKNAFAVLLNFHRNCASLSFEELEKRTSINKEKLIQYENSSEIPSYETIVTLAAAMNVNTRDLLPNDIIEDKVIVQYYKDSAKWYFPQTTKAYEIVELVHSRNLPFSKAFEFTTLKENDSNSLEELDLIVGLHQYIYNVGESTVHLNWKINNESHLEELKPGDSAYIKPNVPHNFRSNGKLMVLRIAGRIAGDAQRELSSLDKNDAHRAISEVSMWFDPLEKTSIG